MMVFKFHWKLSASKDLLLIGKLFIDIFKEKVKVRLRILFGFSEKSQAFNTFYFICVFKTSETQRHILFPAA